MKAKNKFRIIALLSLLAFASCLSEELIDNNKNEDPVSIVINTADGRAIVGGSEADNAITRIDVLMFDINNNNRFVGRVFPITESNQTTFTVTVPGGRYYDLVILANAKHIVDAAGSRLVAGVTTKAAAYALLMELLPGAPPTGVWNAQSGSIGYKDFPMWGEVSVNTINETAAGTISADAALVRMLAKINLSFANQTISDKLRITEVLLCNFSSQGFLASRYWIRDNPRASAPDATDTKQEGYHNRLVYSGNAIRNNAIIDEVFLFEVAPPPNPSNPSVDDRVASTCLIVKGFYNSATEPSFYRIDIRDASGRYLGITRNHAYEIVIQDVTGSGANTGEIAYNSETVNIVTTVREWTMGYRVDVDYNDGHYQLIVNKEEFTFDASGNLEQILTVFSNHPGGWAIEPGYPEWIKVSPQGDKNSDDSENVAIRCESNMSGGSRTGEFYITTALLRKKITVTQM